MVEYIYDHPSVAPQESPHWLGLEHEESDEWIQTIDELKDRLASDLASSLVEDRLALWSCLLGYCEALCTNKQIRYSIYPIPISALERLVRTEFSPRPFVPSLSSSQDERTHRTTAQDVSNWIWSRVTSKSNVKDEQHANSLYIVLRGKVDGKSVDCFGAALCTVIGLRQFGYKNSILTLSEDHAYESHYDDKSGALCTCEVAIPGNTKSQKQKRGQEIAATFKDSKNKLTPETSWLYMAMAPIQCRTAPMILAAALANLNCLIEWKKGKTSLERYSEPLLVLKRELLWMLKDGGHIDTFPFALCELGFSEEHSTSSSRGDVMISVPDLAPVPVTTIEGLYHQAITCSKTHYLDKQVYPYCYMGYYHKDGGQDDEYRLGVALKYFAEASRVASEYPYEWGDCLQLTKIFTKLSEYIVDEILSKDQAPRMWQSEMNAVDAGRWLATFFDHLLVWEERTNDQFLPILQSNHKTGITKAFSLMSHDVRTKVFAQTGTTLQSRRLNGTLGDALQSEKIAVSDMQLTIVISQSGRRRKRKER